MAPDDYGRPPLLTQGQAVPKDVRGAVAYMRQAMESRVTEADLSRVCGVPARTLRRHFLAFIGHPPLVHFRLVRLSAAREAMLTPGTASITEIATRFGFNHLGRFSAEYRRRFGEPPSATLSRGRSTAAEVGVAQAHDSSRSRLSISTSDADGWPHSPARRRQAPPLNVLRFRIGTADPEVRAFAEGLVEHLAAKLSRAHGLSIRIARTQIGETGRVAYGAGARYCLTGHVTQSSEGRVRILLRLLDLAEGERHLWGDAYDGTKADLFELQDRVVDGAVCAIRPGIEEAEIECARRKPVRDARARDLVLRAMPFVLAGDPASARGALGLLEEAMDLDPDDPAPIALAGWCRTQLVLYQATPNPVAERCAGRRLAERALALDPLGDPLVLTARSGVMMGVRPREEVDALLARALVIDPGFVWAWERSALMCAIHGEAEPALELYRRALHRKGPRSSITLCLAGMGMAHFEVGRFEPAARLLERAMTENPEAIWLDRILAPCYLALDEFQLARMSVDRLRRASPDTTVERIAAAVPLVFRDPARAGKRQILEGLVKLGVPA